jgi:hypothetical protein
MDRRHFISGVALGLLAVPLAAEAQPAAKVYRIGIITTSAPAIPVAGAKPAERSPVPAAPAVDVPGQRLSATDYVAMTEARGEAIAGRRAAHVGFAPLGRERSPTLSPGSRRARRVHSRQPARRSWPP